jgi:hypothetical protein
MPAQPNMVIFGADGVLYRVICRPASTPAKRPRRTLWSILGFSQKSEGEE